ncbi:MULTISPECIES: hypothetical protein [unclassified Micromonospora]|uniref:hypothetical protein n=1 Tax=unclassified Micromonospora TaxID=2617518 RepID=UPI0033228393
MTVHMAAHDDADKRCRDLLNPPRPTTRYRVLDRNSAPDRSLPAPRPWVPVNRPYDLHSKEGT